MKIKERLSADRVLRAANGSPSQVVFEFIFYIYLAYISIVTFLYTSMYTLELSDRMLDFITISVILFAFAKAASEKSWSRWELLAGVFICGAIAWSWNREARTFMLEFAALIVAARGISFEKILKVYLAVLLPVFAFIIVEALTGRIENLVYVRPNGRIRISFGIVYPTDFCAHVFFLTCCYVWLRERKLSFVEIALVFCLAVFCYYFCDARATAACFILLGLVLLYVKLRRVIARKKEREYTMSRSLSALLCAAAPIAAVVILVLSWVFNENILWMAKLDKLLSYRLYYAHQAFLEYPFTLSGQYVYMRGLGGALEHTGEYFFLDSSYVNIFFRFGLLILVGVVAIMMTGAIRQRKNRSWERLCILAVIAAQCMIEHHLFEIAYDPFLLMLFAVSSTDRQAGCLRGSIRQLRDYYRRPAKAEE